jgi:hypothetical protein
MKIIARLELELNNKDYFTTENYATLLLENGLTSTEEYNKAIHQKSLLYTVIDILEAVCNDVDVLRKVETEFLTTESAYKYLQSRIEKIKQRIYELDVEEKSPISLLFSRK